MEPMFQKEQLFIDLETVTEQMTDDIQSNDIFSFLLSSRHQNSVREYVCFKRQGFSPEETKKWGALQITE